MMPEPTTAASSSAVPTASAMIGRVRVMRGVIRRHSRVLRRESSHSGTCHLPGKRAHPQRCVLKRILEVETPELPPVYLSSVVAIPELNISSAFVAFSATDGGSGT